MKVIKAKKSVINTLDSSVRKTRQTIGRSKEEIKKGLTASVIGGQEEEESDGSSRAGSRKKGTSAVESVWRRPAYQSMSANRHTSASVNDITDIKYRQNIAAARADQKRRRDRDSTGSSLPRTSNAVGTKRQAADIGRGGSTAKGKSAAAGAAAKEASKGGAATGAKAAAGTAAGAATAGVSTAVTTSAGVARRATKRAADQAQQIAAALYGSQTANRTSSGSNEVLDEGMGRKKKSGGEKGYLLLGGALAFSMLLLSFFAFIILPLSHEERRKQEELANRSQQIVEVVKKELEESSLNVGGGKYKAWYGMDDNWCAMFVSWCANECGCIEDGIIPKTASVSNMKQWYIDRNLFHLKEGYEPKPGDIVIFGNGSSHTGIVIDYNAETKTVVTVEGNTGSSDTMPYHRGSHVRQKLYPLTHARIAGYGSLEYKVNEEETETSMLETSET